MKGVCVCVWVGGRRGWYGMDCGGLDTGSKFLNKIGQAIVEAKVWRVCVCACMWVGGGGVVWHGLWRTWHRLQVPQQNWTGYCRSKCMKCGCGGRSGMAWIVEDLTLAQSSSAKLDRPLQKQRYDGGWVGWYSVGCGGLDIGTDSSTKLDRPLYRQRYEVFVCVRGGEGTEWSNNYSLIIWLIIIE